MTTAEPLNARINALGKSLIKAAKKFGEHDMRYYAAALTYQIFFSLFPFLIFFVAVLGALNILGYFDQLLEQAQVLIPEQAPGIVVQALEQIRSQAQTFLSLSIIVALWSASTAVRMTMHALDVAYEVKEKRPVWKNYPLSILYTILLAVLIIIAAGLMLIGSEVVGWLAQQIGLGSVFVALWSWLRIPVAVLLLIVGLALVYYFFPNTDFSLRSIAPGAVLAIIGWLGASFGFSFYVKNFASYSATYGSLAAIIVLLLYLYISACVLLLGAEVNAQIYFQFAEDHNGDEKAQEFCSSEE
jgi:membrane protein